MVKIIDFAPQHLDAWKNLNIAWISRDYDVEDVDIETLSFPEKYFLKDGGAILLAELNGEIVGTVALQPFGNNEYELAKMTVKDGLRGLKIGEKLGIACLEKAQAVGAKKVFLFSNTKAWQALNLYFKLGFRVCSLGDSEFKRANIKMEIDFPSPAYRPVLRHSEGFSAVKTAFDLTAVLKKNLPFLKEIPEERALQKRGDGGWSAIQIIGHLIDSACNNHQKWVRAAQFPGSKFPPYDADFWVAMSGYQEYQWQWTLAHWENYQRQLGQVMAWMPEKYWANEIEVVGYGRCTLGYMMEDYVAHHQHHLSQILRQSEF